MSTNPTIPDIPLTLPAEVREILEPMKTMLDQLVLIVDPSKIPTQKPTITGKVWSDNGLLKVT